MKCNNELCGQELSNKAPQNQSNLAAAAGGQPGNGGHDNNNNQQDKIVRFQINGVEMIACSKKCKKVAKFAYLLKKNNEN